MDGEQATGIINIVFAITVLLILLKVCGILSLPYSIIIIPFFASAILWMIVMMKEIIFE